MVYLMHTIEQLVYTFKYCIWTDQRSSQRSKKI